MPLRLASLCSGYGGLELGLALAGVPFELSWYAEIDRHASAVMAHHHPEVPNLGDLTTIAAPPAVDIVAAGWPCQPVSAAGARKGTEDARWIIRDVVRIARESGARWLILENVSGLFSANQGEAFGQVCDALAEGGWSAEWAPVRASDAGAPHRRERWFCLAAVQDTDGEPRLQRGQPAPGQEEGRRARPEPTGRSGVAAANTDGIEPQRRGESRELGSKAPAQPGQEDQRQRAGHTAGHSCEADRFGVYGPAVARWETVTRPAPSPTTPEGRLSPGFVEWMMGLPEGHVTDVPGLSRARALKILGNGVVPQQAALALNHLIGCDS